MFATSYFSMLKKVDENFVPVAITLYKPKGIDIVSFSSLAPSLSILSQFKKDGSKESFVQRFGDEILSNLNADKVVDDLLYLTQGKPFCLLCYEKSNDFCHRHLVSNWLKESGYSIAELSFSQDRPLF